jgi:hypothetical protein
MGVKASYGVGVKVSSGMGMGLPMLYATYIQRHNQLSPLHSPLSVLVKKPGFGN